MIPSSGCPPWPPDHPRTLPRTGTPTPLPGARPDVSEAATVLLIYLATIVAAGWFLVFLAPVDSGMRQRPEGQPRLPTWYRRGAWAGWRRLANTGAPQRKAK